MALPKAPWETDPRVRAARPARPSAPVAGKPAGVARRPVPPAKTTLDSSASFLDGSWADATEKSPEKPPPKLDLPRSQTSPWTKKEGGALAEAEPIPKSPTVKPAQKLRAEPRPNPAGADLPTARGAQPWDEVIGRADSATLERWGTTRDAEAETHVGLKRPPGLAPSRDATRPANRAPDREDTAPVAQPKVTSIDREDTVLKDASPDRALSAADTHNELSPMRSRPAPQSAPPRSAPPPRPAPRSAPPPRARSATLPPFEAPTIRRPPSPQPPSPPPATRAQRPDAPQPATSVQRPAAVRSAVPPTATTVPSKSVSRPPSPRREIPRDETIKGVIMGPDPSHEPELQNAQVQLRRLTEDLGAPEPSNYRESDVNQATAFGELAAGEPLPSTGKAVAPMTAGSSVPAFGSEAHKLRKDARAALRNDTLPRPWEVDDPSEVSLRGLEEPSSESLPMHDANARLAAYAAEAGAAGAMPSPPRQVVQEETRELFVPDLGIDAGPDSMGEVPAWTGELDAVNAALPKEEAETVVRVPGLMRRIIALTLDLSLLLAAIVTPAIFGLFGDRLTKLEALSLDGFTSLVHSGDLILPGAVLVGLAFFSSVFFHAVIGRTPGELLTGLRVVRTKNAELPGIVRAVIRALLTLVLGAFAGVGYFWAILDKRHRTLQDILTGTVVIRGKPVVL